jgi:uncharacterized membrane protein YhaH (DUF805 family)/uncharacterized membrane protein YphA (DoxX/SURF4 family)
MKHLVLIARVVFGAWMLANGVNHFFPVLYPEPVGHEPLAAQLMAALVHSRLLDVAMVIQLVTGALILAGLLLPVALCVVMPVSVCAAFWAVVLDHQPVAAVLSLAALALNALLCLAYLDYYKDMLVRRANAVDETTSSYDDTYARPNGRTSQRPYALALIPLAAAAAFYVFIARAGLNGEWVLATLLFPGLMLMARRLHDMGQTAWILLAPGLLDIAAISLHFANALHFTTLSLPALSWTAVVVSVAFLLWGLVGKGQADANRFGEAAAA